MPGPTIDVDLRAVNYSTWTPVLDSAVAIRDAAQEVVDRVDAIERAISHEKPDTASLRAARDALGQLPTAVLRLESACRPGKLVVLRRRVARLFGVKAGDPPRRHEAVFS